MLLQLTLQLHSSYTSRGQTGVRCLLTAADLALCWRIVSIFVCVATPFHWRLAPATLYAYIISISCGRSADRLASRGEEELQRRIHTLTILLRVVIKTQARLRTRLAQFEFWAINILCILAVVGCLDTTWKTRKPCCRRETARCRCKFWSIPTASWAKAEWMRNWKYHLTFSGAGTAHNLYCYV